MDSGGISSGRWDFSRVMRPTAEAEGLPNVAYVDEDFFAEETAKVFHGGWVCAGVGAEILNPGDLKPVELAGVSILLVRAKDGQIRAFHNVCSHRGVKLCETEMRGKRLMTCPYHAWAYDLDGNLRSTPHVGGNGIHEDPAIDKSKLGLKAIRTAVWGPFIFVDLSGEAPEFEDHLAPLMKRWEAYDFDLLRRVGHQQFDLAANWKLATENYLEFYHLSAVHPALSSYSRPEDHYFITGVEPVIGAGTTAYSPGLNCGQELPHFPGLTAEQEAIGEYPAIFPNLWLGIQCDHVFAMILYPDGPGKTREVFHLFFIGEKAADGHLDPARDETLARWAQVMLEDQGIVERMQEGRHSRSFDGGKLTPANDYANHYFMRHLVEVMQG